MIGSVGSTFFSRPLNGPASVKQTASPSPSNQSTYNPGISELIGQYLGDLDSDNVEVRTAAALHSMTLAGSDIPEDQKTRMIYPAASTLSAVLLRESPSNVDLQRYLTRALAILLSEPNLSFILRGISYDALSGALKSRDALTQAYATRVFNPADRF